jgi:hypothetical protein
MRVRNVIAPIVCGLVGLLSTGAAAQVGYPPSRSPYIDLERNQELTLTVGSFHAQRDPAAAAPQGGLIVGAHYEWRAGGPAYLIGDLSRISSSRDIINPFGVGAARSLGTTNRPLYTGSVGLGIGLTGAKSWHHLAPELAGGVGLISDLRSAADTGGFKFGTRFALNWGGGLRWVPGNRWQVRGDITNRLYTISYPEAFYTSPSGGAPVIQQSQSKSFWTNNPAFTLGISRLF